MEATPAAAAANSLPNQAPSAVPPAMPRQRPSSANPSRSSISAVNTQSPAPMQPHQSPVHTQPLHSQHDDSAPAISAPAPASAPLQPQPPAADISSTSTSDKEDLPSLQASLSTTSYELDDSLHLQQTTDLLEAHAESSCFILRKEGSGRELIHHGKWKAEWIYDRHSNPLRKIISFQQFQIQLQTPHDL